MPLTEMQMHGSNAYVARLLSLGYSYSQVLSHLATRYGAEGFGERSRAASYGQEARGAALYLQQYGTLEGGPYASERISPGALPGYTYYVQFEITGPGAAPGTFRSMTLTSTSLLGLADLAALSAETFGALYGQGGRRREYEGFSLPVMMAGLEVIAVERGA